MTAPSLRRVPNTPEGALRHQERMANLLADLRDAANGLSDITGTPTGTDAAIISDIQDTVNALLAALRD